MSTELGQKAERIAGKFLEKNGYEIIEYNWRLPQCEIDIVAKNNNRVFLVEVKYRKNENYGSGFDYITTKKLKQMRFAASNWKAYNNWRGSVLLSAIEVTGNPPEVSACVLDIG
ncbi:MAG: YraN family protein [bacterium]|nr:YraN family protein [bacterium]